MPPLYVVLDKKLGQTPLHAIDVWRIENPVFKDIPATYAGRLDPMATGRLLVVLGDECKRQEKYRGLDKEYEIEVLLDVSTDTGDALGMPAYAGLVSHPSAEQIHTVVRAQAGTAVVPYPSFSSKTVDGKPLFQYALEGTLDTISIPTHEETIYRIHGEELREISTEELRRNVKDLISCAPRSLEPSKELGADFRQDAIAHAWQEMLSAIGNRTFVVLTLRVTCASGTYMRTLADRIGKGVGTRGVALSIHRTKIGRYRGLLGVGFWTQEY